MRIISQNGEIDVPYEMSAIRNEDNAIILNMAGETGKGSVIATYSTSEKAEKAMEMLHKAYTGMPVVMQNAEVTDELKKQFDNSFRTGIMLLNEKEEAPKIDLLDNSIFQFPQDEDVEV